MTQSESLQVFLRFLNQRYEELKIHLEQMLRSMSTNDEQKKISSTREFLTSASGLALTLAPSDRPKWLKELIDHSEWYVASMGISEANHTHLMRIMANYEKAMSHDWLFNHTNADLGYSFDEMYELYQQDSRIQEHCDGLVETLNFMIDSCEIDSVSAINSLDQLIRLIERNRRGSFSSMLATNDFISRFIKNGTWMHIRKIPGVKNLKDNFEKTAKELDNELDRLQKDITNDVQSSFDESARPTPQHTRTKPVLLETA